MGAATLLVVEKTVVVEAVNEQPVVSTVVDDVQVVDVIVEPAEVMVARTQSEVTRATADAEQDEL